MGETRSDESHNLNLTPSIALQDTVIRIHSELVDISRDIFKMHFSSNFTRGGLTSLTRCLSLPNLCKTINEQISSITAQYDDVLLLEDPEKVLDKSCLVPLVFIHRIGTGSRARTSYHTLSVIDNEPYVLFFTLVDQPEFGITARLSSSDFRSITSSLFEDAVNIAEQARFELTESQSIIDEMQSRSLAEIPIQISEGSELLNGRYTDLKRIGEGHNGIVWKAKEPKMGRDVAI